MENIYRATSSAIQGLKETLPGILLEKHFALQPSLRKKYGDRQIALYKEDTRYHLTYLAESIASEEPVLFNEYLGWAKSFFAQLPVTDEEIIVNLELLRDTVAESVSGEMEPIVRRYVDDGIRFYTSYSPVIRSFITDENPHRALAEQYLQRLIDGNKKEAHEMIVKAIEKGVRLKDLYLHVFQVTQKETGRLWQMSKISVAHEHFITAATQSIMAHLYPYLFTEKNTGKKIIVSCIEGELHEIGARMLADFFEMDGWNSYYFGANTPRSSLVSAIRMFTPEIVAISATMTFNISSVESLIRQIREEHFSHPMNILVGGYPFALSGNIWRKVGADGFAADAQGAIQLADTMTEMRGNG